MAVWGLVNGELWAAAVVVVVWGWNMVNCGRLWVPLGGAVWLVNFGWLSGSGNFGLAWVGLVVVVISILILWLSGLLAWWRASVSPGLACRGLR